MLAHRLTIENHDYVLNADTDVDALQLEICDAMRKGGGIVSFTTSTHRTLTAIVSPGVPVTFEAFTPPDELGATADGSETDDAWPDDF